VHRSESAFLTGKQGGAGVKVVKRGKKGRKENFRRKVIPKQRTPERQQRKNILWQK